MKQIRTVFSPALYPYVRREGEYLVVVVDILRASTTICTAIEHGATLIPKKTVEEARKAKEEGCLVAGERVEEDFSFADFGNSATEFITDKINGREIIHSTTNGTRAIRIAMEYSPEEILIGAFSNIDTLVSYLKDKKCDIEIFCSGWKNNFCIEDTVFAGALAERLIKEGDFINKDDSTFTAINLWNAAKDDLLSFMENASHIHRLRKRNLQEVFPYTFTLNTCHSIPIVKDDRIVKL